MSDCTKRMTPVCEEVRHEAEASGECPKFSAPLPFGGNISSNGRCVSYRAPASPPADGTYGKVVVRNGVIVDALEEEVEQYTSSPCAPVPTPCDCAGGESGSLPQPSTVSGNLYGYDAANRPYAVVHVEAGSGIAVEGNGTSANPLTISANAEGATTSLRSANTAITVSGDGSSGNPYVVAHKSNESSQKYRGFSFDIYGHFLSYATPTDEAGAVQGIIAGNGIDVKMTSSGQVATISLAGALGNGEYVPNGEYILGGWRLKVKDNQLATMTRELTTPAGTYNLGGWVVQTNEFGSLSSIAEDATGVALSGKSYRNASTSITSASTTITLGRTSGLRVIAYCKGATMPTTASISIDGSDITTDAMLNQAHALSNALYGVGTHTVAISSTTAITGPLYIDIHMVEVV